MRWNCRLAVKCALGALFTFFFSCPLHALPVYTLFKTFNDNGTSTSYGPGTHNSSVPLGTTVVGGLSAGIGVPFLSVSASAAGGSTFGSAEATADASFEWVGPTGLAGSLPVDITTDLQTTASLAPGATGQRTEGLATFT